MTNPIKLNIEDNRFHIRNTKEYQEELKILEELKEKSKSFNQFNHQITDLKNKNKSILLKKEEEQILIYLLNLSKTYLLMFLLINEKNFKYFEETFEEYISLKEDNEDFAEEEVDEIKKMFNMNYSEKEKNKKRISYASRDVMAYKDMQIIKKEIRKLRKISIEKVLTQKVVSNSAKKLIQSFNLLNPTNYLIKEMTTFSLLSKKIIIEEKQKYILESNQKVMSDVVNILVKFNMRLVLSISKKYINKVKSGIDFEDIKNEGLIGFVNAIFKFEINSDLKISTYATWWIRQAIISYINDNKNTISVPLYYIKILSDYNNLIQKIEIKGNKKEKEMINNLDWMANKLNISLKKLEKALYFTKNSYSVSFSQQNSEDNEEYSLEDSISYDEKDFIDQSIEEEQKNMIKSSLQYLTEKEKLIIMERHELFNDNPKTLEELGKKLNLTKERIRQIEMEAFKKIKKILSEYFED